jgi:sulfite reductase beta subunit-like hemoprotein
MKSALSTISAALTGVALLVAFSVRPAAGETGNRALERVLARGAYSADEGARVQRSYAAALQAGVEGREALSLVEACVRGRFDASQTLRMLSIAAQLALEGLPVEGFAAKVEEGVSKRVDPDRVAQAAERRALMLNKSRQILNGLVLQGLSVGDRDELLPDLAEALEAGRAPEEARAILSDALRDGERPGSIRRKLFP